RKEPKEPSGAQKRKARRQRRQANAALERARQSLSATYPRLEQLIEDLGPPPLDVIGGVSWAHKVTQILLHVVLRDPAMLLPDKLRWSKDLIGLLGYTTAKAITDERIANLERDSVGE